MTKQCSSCGGDCGKKCQRANVDQYATAEESASVMRTGTPNELWLHRELDRIAPDRREMGSTGDVPALVKLIFELKGQLPKDVPEYFGLEPWQTQEAIQAAAEQLVKRATQAGLVVTIERTPLKPLAMGHATSVVDVRPARGAQ